MKYKILSVLLLPLFSFDCMPKSAQANILVVENQLPVNVYCVPSFQYPDTSLNFTNKSVIEANQGAYFLKAGTKTQLFRHALGNKYTWDHFMDTDTIQIFVLDEKVVKEKSWGQIYSYDLYLRRLVLSYSDIFDNNCTIIIK